MSKPSDEYWRERRDEFLAQLEKDESALRKRLEKVYASEAAKLDRLIAAYYAQYGEDKVIEYRRLLQSISAEDHTLLMERMDDFAKKYPQYADLMPVRESIYRLNELEAIQLQIRIQQYEIGAIEQAELQRHFSEQARRAANMAAEELGFEIEVDESIQAEERPAKRKDKKRDEKKDEAAEATETEAPAEEQAE